MSRPRSWAGAASGSRHEKIAGKWAKRRGEAFMGRPGPEKLNVGRVHVNGVSKLNTGWTRWALTTRACPFRRPRLAASAAPPNLGLLPLLLTLHLTFGAPQAPSPPPQLPGATAGCVSLLHVSLQNQTQVDRAVGARMIVILMIATVTI